jgi:hypothetical protein
MKQEILCTKCEESTRKQFPNESPYPGEHVKFVSGKANEDFICDHCNTEISEDENCCAFSIWADYGGQPYFEWESNFIKKEQDE